MCHVGVSNEGRSPSTAIGPSNDCKEAFNQASARRGAMPWPILMGGNELFFDVFSGRPPVCHSGVFHESRSPATAIGYPTIANGRSMRPGGCKAVGGVGGQTEAVGAEPTVIPEGGGGYNPFKRRPAPPPPVSWDKQRSEAFFMGPGLSHAVVPCSSRLRRPRKTELGPSRES